jgi:uncharacterized repeat protein (TIGR01451 family)
MVPAADQNPRLRFWHWFSFNAGDYGQVQISTDNITWTTISTTFANTSSNAWTYPLIDLSAYAGQKVFFAFYFHSQQVGFNPNTSSGWYIDEVAVVTGALVFNNPEGWEQGIGDWSAERGTWEIGKPASGTAYSGINCAATTLSGNYHEGVDSRLVSPPFMVPAADQNPRLRFWHWFSFNAGDYGQVQISTDNITWTTISTTFANTSSNAWTYPLIDLSAYAGQKVFFAFYFHSQQVGFNPNTSSGWYIDEVAVVTGALVFNNPEGWEQGIGDWSAERGTWEIGKPASGTAYSGINCAATTLSGNYHEGVDSRLVSPPFMVPAADQNPRLRFWHWFSFNAGDYGQVQISTDNITWTTISTTFANTSSNAWTYPLIDLSAYAGQKVFFAFYFHSQQVGFNPNTSSGWYIDEVAVVTGALVFNNPEGWEQGIGDWSAERGTWEIGKPASGTAYSGINCAATTLSGNYHEGVDSRLVSPPFMVPAADQNPRLRFWHWFSFNAGDYGQVQISTDNITWTTISTTFANTSSNAWTYPLIDLSAYAGQKVFFAFYFHSQQVGFNPNTSSGWYIDEVAVVTGALVFNNPEGWEQGIGDWSAERGTWEIGKPASGTAYSGINCAATTLSGNYHEGVDSRLVSPPFMVPAADQNPRLRFWHWFSFNAGDYGQVQISTDNITWTTISTTFANTSSNAWTYPLIDLSAYAGQKVFFAFYFHSQQVGFNPNTSSGWYIDEVAVVTGALVFNNPEGWEQGIGDWSAERGTWEIGKPASGTAYSGINCAATTLSGNYHEGVDSRLVSPPFMVPAADQNPRFRFWHRFSFEAGDYGQVEIKVEGGEWKTILGPYSGTSGGEWRRPFYDLSLYADSTVQIAFLFHSQQIGFNPNTSSGWHIDDIISQALPILPSSEIRVRKTGTAAVPGRKVDHFIHVENVGDVIATNVQVFDILDSSFTLLSVNPPAETDTSKSSFVLWTIPELVPGDFKILSHQAKLNPSTPVGKDVSRPTCTTKQLEELKDCSLG